MRSGPFFTPTRSTASRRALSYASSRRFLPSDVAEVVNWLDAQHAPSVLNASLAAAAHNEKVNTWNSRVGSIDFLQTTDAARLTLIDDGFGANGKRRLRMNGTSTFMTHAGVISTAASGGILMVVRPDDQTGFGEIYALTLASGGSNYWEIAHKSTDTNFRILSRTAGAGPAISLDHDGALMANSAALVDIRSDGATHTLRVSSNFSETLSGTNNGDWWGDIVSPNTVTIGCRNRSSTQDLFFKGDLYEIIQYDGVLPAAKMQALRNYLLSKYAIRRTACLGDSLTAASPNWVPNLRVNLDDTTCDGFSFVNHGVSSDTVAQMKTRWTNNIRNKGFDYLIFLGGINDIKVGTSAAAIWADYEAVIDEALADGLRVLPASVTPFGNKVDPNGWTAAKQTELDTLNTLIRDKAFANFGRMAFIDSYDGLGDPADPVDLLAAYDSGDGLHWNATGGQAFADLVEPAIVGLF